MSYYYKYNFISPEPIFIRVKEELRSYYETGAIDDTLFPVYVNRCLQKLGRSTYPVAQAILTIDGYKSNLPEDFYATREAWMCSSYLSDYQLPTATYQQVTNTAFKVDTLSENDVFCNPCKSCEYPDIIEAVYKVTNTVLFRVQKQYLLTPGNIYPSCPDDLYCANFGAVAPNSYEVRDGKFVTTFREGKVYIQYYSNQVDDAENQLIPDVIEIQDYIELYLKEKAFEQLYNQTTDESIRQIEAKFYSYKQRADEALIIARTEMKKEDPYRQQRAIRRVRNRFRKFNIR